MSILLILKTASGLTQLYWVVFLSIILVGILTKQNVEIWECNDISTIEGPQGKTYKRADNQPARQEHCLVNSENPNNIQYQHLRNF